MKAYIEGGHGYAKEALPGWKAADMMLMVMCLIVMAASAWSAAHRLRNIILILGARRRGGNELAPAPSRE